MRAHQERVRNEGQVIASLPPRTAATAEPQGKGLLAGRQLEDFLAASLAEDLAALKGMASVAAKVAHKRDALLPKYAPYVARLREQGAKHDLLGYWLVWLFDAARMDEAMEYAEWCMNSGICLPQRFQSTVPFFVASQVADWAEGEFNGNRSVEPYFTSCAQAIAQNPAAWNLPDDLTARFHRLQGLAAERAGNLAEAETQLQKALNLGAKVNTALARVRKKIERGGAAPEGETAAEGDSPAASPQED